MDFTDYKYQRGERFYLLIPVRMKLIVFLKNKKEVVISDGKHFLQQRYNGSKSILMSSKRKKVKKIERKEIKDFIQARYYHIFKEVFVPIKRAY